MPNGFVPDEGASNTLLRILDPQNRGGYTAWYLILWVNDIVPDFSITRLDLQEATFGGYSFVTLNPLTWTDPVITSGCAESTYDDEALVWYVTSGPVETIYGYALIDSDDLTLKFVQRFDDADIAPAPVGSRVVLLPRYTHTSAACPGYGAVATSRRRNLK